jgi:hypothetical protein
VGPPHKSSGKLALEPRLPQPQIPPDGFHGNIEQPGTLLRRQTAEEAHFNHSRFPRILRIQLPHRAFEIQKDFRMRVTHFRDGFKPNLRLSAAALSGIACPRMVHQNLPHDLRRYSEKMAAVAVFGLTLTNQPHVGFVHKCSGLKGMVRALPPQVTVRQAAKFRISDGD